MKKKQRGDVAERLQALEETSEWQTQEIEGQKAGLAQQKKLLDFVAKGRFVVLEGAAEVESLYIKETGTDGGGYRAFKEGIPGALRKDLEAALGVKIHSNEGSEEDRASIKLVEDALSAPRVLLNAQLQYEQGKGKGKKGKGKGKSKGQDKGKGGEKTRRKEHFVLQLAFGQRMLSVKQELEERLETRLREAAGLDVSRARGLAQQEADTEMQGNEGAEAVEKKRFLVYVEKTEAEREARKRRREQEAEKGKSKGKGKGGKGGKGGGSGASSSGQKGA